MRVNAHTIDEFFAAAGEREPDMRTLDELICKEVPDLAADRHLMITSTMVMMAYGRYHYRYASGKEDNWMAVGLANQKNYISLYVCAVVDDAYVAEGYGKRLGKVSVGKSCIRFKRIEDLNLDEVKNALLDTERWWRDQPAPK